MTVANAENVKTTEAQIEAVARALCKERGGDPDMCISGWSWDAGEAGKAESGSVCFKRNWERFNDSARAAIAAMQAKPPPDDPEPPKDDEDEYGPDREETDDR